MGVGGKLDVAGEAAGFPRRHLGKGRGTAKAGALVKLEQQQRVKARALWFLPHPPPFALGVKIKEGIKGRMRRESSSD